MGQLQSQIDNANTFVVTYTTDASPEVTQKDNNIAGGMPSDQADALFLSSILNRIATEIAQEAVLASQTQAQLQAQIDALQAQINNMPVVSISVAPLPPAP